MAVEWLAATLLAIKHHEDIKKLLTGGLAKLFGRKTLIAFTGMQGVGKTVLLDHLTGKAMKADYKLPLQSEKAESATVAVAKKRLRVTVVPGQDANPKHVAFDDLFTGKTPVAGVVHVVANGFTTVRTAGAIRTLIKDLKIDTLPKFRESQRQEELKDLDATCRAIRDSHRKHHAPKWMIVAVDKYDLYADKPEKVRQYYEGNSEFTERLQTLREQVGTDNFRWATIPVCCLLELFTWHRQTIDPKIDERARDAFLSQFLLELANYCK